tara:strand:- start:154 stop:654 length:501 start_codon:yes stop_codon:yes gene_type:complete
MNKKKKEKKSLKSQTKRIFLVVADDTSEMHQALYYASRRAATANGEVALFRCIEPPEGQLWGGVTKIMEAEAEQASKKLLTDLSLYCEELGAAKPKTFLKKGNVSDELIKLINNESLITVLVLGASTETGNPGPLVNYVINASSECRIPITIVPGNLTDEQIDNLI